MTPFNLNIALETLKKGLPIGFPTETVYGLAANALDDKAVAHIYTLKKRPKFNPLIAHVASIEKAEQYVIFTNHARLLAKAFWPGPLTLVLEQKKDSGISTLATAGLSTLAVRQPAHPMALELLQHLDFPLVAPSANPSESISPTSAKDVQEAFTDLYVLDGGPCTVGLESTILDLTTSTPTLLRPGAITIEQLENVLDTTIMPYKGDKILAPGQMKRHYAPSLPLRLNADSVKPEEALLSFGKHEMKICREELNLSPTGNLKEAAANLFRYLRQLDNPSKNAGIAVAPIPQEGLGLAINDRLHRAAEPSKS